MRPGMAASDHGVDLAVRPFDRRIRVLRATETAHRLEIPTDERTPGTPALAPFGDELLVAWHGSDWHLNLARTRGSALSVPTRLEHTTLLSASLSTSGSTVALAWTGTDRHLNLMVGEAHWRLEPTSDEGPSVCAVDGGVVLAWAGDDDRLNVATIVNGEVRTPLRIEERTFYEPQLVPHAGGLVLVWTGTRGEVCVAHLSR